MAISHRAGEFIGFSEGEYSDYSFGDLYRVLVDFDLAKAASECIPQLKALALLQGKSIPDWVEEDDIPNFLAGAHDCGSSAFGSYLMRLGYVEPVAYDTIHLGSYGRLDVDPVIRHGQHRAEQLARNPE